MKAVAILLLAAAVARADGAGADQPARIEIEVGTTIERSVGTLRGFRCDDPTLVKAELVTRADVNVWIVSGEKVGTTQCRVGTELYRAGQVFEVVVIAAKKKAS